MTELTPIGGHPSLAAPNVNVHNNEGEPSNATNGHAPSLAPPPAQPPAGISEHQVAFHFEAGDHNAAAVHTNPNQSAPAPAVPSPAPTPVSQANPTPAVGSGGGEDDFLARFRANEPSSDDTKLSVKPARREIDAETMARLNARAGIYSGGYEQLLALRAKPTKGEATLKDIRALEELHANTIRAKEGKGPAQDLDSMMVGGGQQLKSIIHDGHEISIGEMGRIIADHKDATDTMRARQAAAKKAGIPSFEAPPPASTGGEKPTAGPTVATAPGAPGAKPDLKGEDWHLIPESELFSRLNTSLEKGLDTATHTKRFEEIGPNILTPPPSTPFWLKCLINLIGGFQLMLWGGAALSFVVYGLSGGTDTQTLVLALVLIIVVLLSTSFQMYQEGKSDSVMASLKALTPATCTVIRDGQPSIQAASTLVPGDIVKVTAGDKVPADMRILRSHDLKVNNSALTGEPDDIKLGPDAKADVITEAKNIARTGCAFTFGDGTGVVFATGDRTLFGTIARATTGTKRPDSLMKKEIQRLIHIMACIAFTLGIAFLILALFNGYKAVDAVVFMIGIIVANVPEGLLPQMTVALTLTAQRMRDKNVLVSNLEIIETLGATTVICSDKTGTLTCNRMTVSHLYYDNQIWCTPLTPNMKGDDFKEYDAKHPIFVALQRSMTLNTNASWLTREDNVLKRSTKGDASETALIKFVEPIRPIDEYRNACPRKFLIPFNSANKWAASINQLEDSNAPLYLLLKGAPDIVLGKCANVLRMVNGQPTLVPMDAERKADFERANLNLCRRGERVLALCELPLDPTKCNASTVFEYDRDDHGKIVSNFPLDGLTFVGLVSLIDPPRQTVPGSVAECYKAGIQVFMVTGDHPETAHAIAKSIGLVTKPTQEEIDEELAEKKHAIEGGRATATHDENGKPWPEHHNQKAGAFVVHGQKLADYTDKDWEHLFSHPEVVFARTQPIQKQTIVNKLKARGHIVAMTGDGVNDAPALKAANAGLAMGSGTTVAKEAASIILMDDNFSSIVEGVREGRLIFENLKKCIAYVLSSNIPELLPFLFFIAARIPLGLETIMILLVDLGTDLAPAVSLAYEEPEAAIMEQPPRNQITDHIVGLRLMVVAYLTMGVFETFAAYFAFFWVYADYGFDFKDLFGAGPNYRDHYDCTFGNDGCEQMDDDRRRWFDDLCLKTNNYGGYRRQELGANSDGNFCAAPLYNATTGLWSWTMDDLTRGEDFRDYLQEVLGHAQTAFLMTVVWTQVANVLMRKTMKASLWDFGIRSNKVLLGCILQMIILIILLVYIPGLNEGLLLRPISTKNACTGLWMLPFMILFEETRKLIIRRSPGGILEKLTKF